ncbi:protein of unknown function [Paraburkholderia kururiensis]
MPRRLAVVGNSLERAWITFAVPLGVRDRHRERCEQALLSYLLWFTGPGE